MDRFRIPEKHLPSAEDVQFYREHGWFKTGKVLGDDLLEAALKGLNQHWSGQRDGKLPPESGFADWMPGSGDSTRKNEYLSLQNNCVRRLALSPIIGAIAARLAAATEIRLFDDLMLYKPAEQSDGFNDWHIDAESWATCSSPDMLSAWIPLHDCSETLGPLIVIDGSHKWSDQLKLDEATLQSSTIEDLRRIAESLGKPFEVVPMTLERGQMSFHHARTIHGSYPNHGKRARVALTVHLQDGANHFAAGPNGAASTTSSVTDRICRKNAAGQPDYADTSVFPVLWRA